jgi:hypothetical protein
LLKESQEVNKHKIFLQELCYQLGLNLRELEELKLEEAMASIEQAFYTVREDAYWKGKEEFPEHLFLKNKNKETQDNKKSYGK